MALFQSQSFAKSASLFAFTLTFAVQSFATVYYGEAGEPGRADGTGGRGGRGGGPGTSYSTVSMNGEEWAPVQPGQTARPDRNGNRVVINGVEWASPGQPGKSGAEGGAGGAGGKVVITQQAPATKKVQPAAPAKAVMSTPLDKQSVMLDFACSEGTNYTVFLDTRSPMKADDGKTELQRVAAFCPDIKKIDVGGVVVQDLLDCRKAAITEEHKACANEFTELNKVKLNDRKQRFVNADLRQGRPVLTANDVAKLDKSCGVNFGAGPVFKDTSCARDLKIAMPTASKQYSCLVDHVRQNGIKNSSPTQLSCYRNVMKIQNAKIMMASTDAAVPAAVQKSAVVQ